VSTLHNADVSAFEPHSIVSDFATTFSIEATPKQISKAAGLETLLPRGASVYLPFLPKTRFLDNLETARQLRHLGFNPVPHLAARGVTGRDELLEALPRYQDAGVDSFLLIAGDLSDPAGSFQNTLDVLDTGLLQRFGVKQLGFAGHPDGHPMADTNELERALRLKLDYARATDTDIWLVTQFVFGTDNIPGWERQLRDAGSDIPVRIGLPGPAKVRTLISYAMQCGVGSSLRMLTKRPSAAKLLSRWTPDELVQELAEHRLSTPASPIAGIHMFPFGGLFGTLEWLKHLRFGTNEGQLDSGAQS
jgi:methylenetetrahydrofolate reductase (NADPH)